MIDHNFRKSPRAQDAMHFLNCAGGVRRMMQDSIRVNNIERLVGERQVFGVGYAQIGGKSVQAETIGGKAYSPVSNCDSRERAGGGLCPIEVVCPPSNPHFRDGP